MSMLSSRAGILILVLFVACAAPALAGEADALAKVEALKQVVADPDATWEAKWDAYREAKAAMKDAEGATKEAAQGAYEAIRADVADGIRREELPLSGWLMAFFGASLMWGGLAFCIGVARKKGGSGGKGAA